MSSTDERLDTQTGLLKWILIGIGSGLIAIGGFVATYITNSLAYRDAGEKYLRDDIKASLDANGKTQADIVTILKTQTKIQEDQAKSQEISDRDLKLLLTEIRDDQKKFPAVSSRQE